nr:hypothetical protein CFP56_41247 [Quercus suber]
MTSADMATSRRSSWCQCRHWPVRHRQEDGLEDSGADLSLIPKLPLMSIMDSWTCMATGRICYRKQKHTSRD